MGIRWEINHVSESASVADYDAFGVFRINKNS
jgi:hypothetical protein